MGVQAAPPRSRKSQCHMTQNPLFLRTLSSEVRTVWHEVSGWEWNLSRLSTELSLPVPPDLLAVIVV